MDLMTTDAAAKMANLTADAIRYHARKGHILTISVQRGATGSMRLFVREDIERFVSQREQARAAKSAVAVGQEA
jgi:DNA-binding transcriptional MerR regulator